MKIGIFYGSTTGNTANLAEEVAKALGVPKACIHDVAQASADDTSVYDALLLGSSTWGSGELQDDWADFLEPLAKSDLAGKKVAFFGCGDSSSFPDTFCDALRLMHDALSNSGCTFVGAYAPEGYCETGSIVCKDGKFVGLAIDDSDDSKNQGRIAAWASQLNAELAF